MLAYVLLSGHSPFGGDTKQETFCNIAQGQLDFPEELFAETSQAALDFISALLIVEARWVRRASCGERWKVEWNGRGQLMTAASCGCLGLGKLGG